MTATTNVCRRCDAPAVIVRGRMWLCDMHYRLDAMRHSAKQDGKVVPTVAELESIFKLCGFTCPVCLRKMNWRRADGADTVITLQHDRDGTIKLLCMSCNSRHSSCEGDSFYQIGPDQKRCGKCKTTKPLAEFSTDKHGRWADKKTTCKTCAKILHDEWISKNRDRYNTYMREYKAKKKKEQEPQ